MSTSPAPTPSKRSAALGITLGVLKYLVPVAASVLSIWLHNQQTVVKVQETAGVIENLT